MSPEDRKFNFERFERTLIENQKGVDRLLEIIGTGTFGISIAFVTGLGSEDLIRSELLMWSWILFGIAILFHIASYLFAIESAHWAMRNINDSPVNQTRIISPDQEKTERQIRKRFNLADQVLRYLVLILMTSGMILLIQFASVNLAVKSAVKEAKYECTLIEAPG